MQLDEWVLCKVYQKSKKKKDENEENIKTITPSVDGRVPAVKCATSQPEGSNSLGVNGNHSDQVSFTNQVIPANSDMEMGHMNIIPPIDPRERTHDHHACPEPLQHQYSFTNQLQALPNSDMEMAYMSTTPMDVRWKRTASQLATFNLQPALMQPACSIALPTHITKEDNIQPLEVLPGTPKEENEDDTKEEYYDVFGTLEDTNFLGFKPGNKFSWF